MPKSYPTPAESAHTDGNQQFSIIGVQGTLGTADVTGSAATVPIGANPLTGTMYVQDLAVGAAAGTNVNVVTGTINVGTITGVSTSANQTNGAQHTALVDDSNNIIQSAIQTSAYANANLGRSLAVVGAVAAFDSTGWTSITGNAANGLDVDVTRLPNIPGGTLAALTTVTTVSNLTNGSVNILTGTLQSSGTTTGVGVVSNLTNGSVNILTGTVTSVSNLTAGTIQLNPVPVPATLQFGTLGTAGGSFFGTLSAASGAGTKHYITGVDIVMNTGTADVRVLAGTLIQGTGVLAAGNFPTGGGISKRITPAFATGTNSELIYHFVGAGTAFINVSYWKGV